MQVRTPATLTISGDGKLEAVVAIGTEEPAIAARGDGSHLIINSGTISASGGKTAIGSADQGIDAYVTINGGHITAVGKDYAYDHASGIASLGNLHKTVINGGYVNASALKVVDNSEQSGFTGDRKSTRLNSSHMRISYAVFCLKKKKKSINILIN